MIFLAVLFVAPIIEPGPPGSWEDRWVLDGHAIMVNDTLKMWYLGVSNASGFYYKGIGLAYSTDSGKTWYKYPGNPVFVADSLSNWERTSAFRSGLWEAVVIYENNEYKMWYQCRSISWNTLYATSPDGIHWTRRNEGVPVLYAGYHEDRRDTLQWDYGYAGARSVIKLNNLYYLFYEGHGYSHYASGMRMGLAIGINETTFTKAGMMGLVFTTDGTPDTLWCGKSIIPNVIIDDNTFILIYSSNSAHTGRATVGLALSRDGINWERYWRNPICDLTQIGIPGGAITSVHWDPSSGLVKELACIARCGWRSFQLCIFYGKLPFLLYKQPEKGFH